MANETKAMFMSDKDALIDRKEFVNNLGNLLSQTREQVVSCVLTSDDLGEYVVVTFKGGATKEINVKMDSYLANVKDVCKYI